MSPKHWTFKKDMPKHLRHQALRVDFGLYGLAWIVRDENDRVLMPDGTMMETFEFYLKTGGHVIGPRDQSAAQYKSWAFEWQQACADRRKEQLRL